MCLTDVDLTEDAEIYQIMKVLIADFLHGYLTKNITKAMHSRTVTLINEKKNECAKII